MTSYAQFQIDEEFKFAVAHTGSNSAEVRLARALMTVGAIESYPANVALALSAAARLHDQNITSSQVIRNYGAAGITHRWVHEAVRAAG